MTGNTSLRTSIAPWITVASGKEAIPFYKSAFDAKEVYRHDDCSGGTVVRFSVDGAEFWVSEESSAGSNPKPAPINGSIRMILTVADPDAFFARALKAGAAVVFPVSEGHGWRVGRLATHSVCIGKSDVRWPNSRGWRLGSWKDRIVGRMPRPHKELRGSAISSPAIE